ncbi:mCG140471 [Anopheles sinensis]|uniref:MCG140471 n=1 Tax=Anopheles sinensis TaxID=74873 RepID=A0A084W0Y7_ANOSI|nr:mCG140471 [Anopheles sinensis]
MSGLDCGVATLVGSINAISTLDVKAGRVHHGETCIPLRTNNVTNVCNYKLLYLPILEYPLVGISNLTFGGSYADRKPSESFSFKNSSFSTL